MHLVTTETPCLAAFAIRPHGTLYSPPVALVTGNKLLNFLHSLTIYSSFGHWLYVIPSSLPQPSKMKFLGSRDHMGFPGHQKGCHSNRGLISLLWSGDSNAHSIHLKAFLSGFERLFWPESYVKKDWLQLAHFLVIQLLQKKKKEKATWKALALDEE